jgi:hypothetical protein
MLGVCPTMPVPPALEFPIVGVEPTALPNVLGGVPVILGCGVVLNGELVTGPGVVGVVEPIPGVVPIPVVVVTAPGVVAAAPGAAAPPPAVPPTWANAGSAASVASSTSGKWERSMWNLLLRPG